MPIIRPNSKPSNQYIRPLMFPELLSNNKQEESYRLRILITRSYYKQRNPLFQGRWLDAKYKQKWSSFVIINCSPSSLASSYCLSISSQPTSYSLRALGKPFYSLSSRIKVKDTYKFDYQYAKYEDSQLIKYQFIRVKEIIKNYRIAQQDIYNIDKTSF